MLKVWTVMVSNTYIRREHKKKKIVREKRLNCVEVLLEWVTIEQLCLRGVPLIHEKKLGGSKNEDQEFMKENTKSSYFQI